MKRLITNNFTLWVVGALAFYSIAFGKPKPWEKVVVPPIDWQPPKFEEFKLSNGIAGLVVPDDEVPLAEFYILFPAPPDPADKVGLTEMTAYALRNGGGVNISADSLNELIEYKAASLSIGSGHNERIYIYGSCLKADLGWLLQTTGEIIRHPAYPEDKIELKRGSMLEWVRRRNDEPDGIAYREFFKLVFPDHPNGREATAATVNAIRRDDLLALHRTVFQSRGVVIGFAGDLTAADAERMANEALGWLTPGEAIAVVPEAPPAVNPGIYYINKDVNQAYLLFGHQTVKYDDPRRHAATIMNYILGGGGFQSVLTKRVRVDEGLAYWVGTGFSTPHSHVGTFRVSTSTRNEQAGRTMAVIDETIAAFVSEGPTEEQFTKAREAFVNSYVWDFESSQDILGNLVVYKWRGLPLDTPQRDLEAYQRLTFEEVRAAARELIHPDKLVRVVVGNQDKFDRSLETMGEVKVLDLKAE